MDEFKQTLVLEMVNEDAARQKTLRFEEWNELADYAAWGGISGFDAEVIKDARRRLIEGDWLQVCKTQVTLKDPSSTPASPGKPADADSYSGTIDYMGFFIT